MLGKRINTIGTPDNRSAVAGRLPIDFIASKVSTQEFKGGFSKPDRTNIKITVKENVSGCSGYALESNLGYLVSVANAESGMNQLGPIPMLLDDITPDCISLRGYKCIKETFYGPVETDNSKIGLSVFYDGGRIDKCVLTRVDTMKNYMYFPDDFESPTGAMSDLELINDALEKCKAAFEESPETQRQTLDIFNARLKSYGPFKAMMALKDKLGFAECLLMDINLEVRSMDTVTASELALFALNSCLQGEEGKFHDDNVAAYMDLFNLMFHGGDGLKPLIRQAVHKADTEEEAISEEEGSAIEDTVIERIAYMSLRVIRPYVINDNFEALDPMERNYFNQIFLKGGNREWYTSKEPKSLLEFLSAEVARKYS